MPMFLVTAAMILPCFSLWNMQLQWEYDPVLDPYAEFVTKTVEEDGIAFAMEHYGLIE